MSPASGQRKLLAGQKDTSTAENALARTLARKSQKSESEAPSTSAPAAGADADLARLIEAWPRLSDPIRRAMLALTDSADKVV